MTYSICVRERAEGGVRYGVAAATRLPAVGSVCPHVSAHGAVATAGVTDPEAGERCLSALAAGRSVGDAIADRTAADGAESQLHGVDAESTAAHTGPDCRPVAGHRTGEGYTVAGTSLEGKEVLAALERGYRENERDAPLVRRLLTALAAGEREGGDRRGEDLPVGSAAVVVATPGTGEPLYHDLRVDASDTPVADLRETYRRAKRGYEAAVERYG
ncbi:DUF1028 domain-containing protein [Haloplanus halophilus]|uniref:DUF1028 domain-containing protein n=1 Tax=Haloplanus halophilus TaxID=2949993 RepID=UPI0020408233|nr:DUF1028 domain-containing protein [Haloplanus sp. GDY1]